MEVVINRCYGGFGLSLKAQREYMRRKGKELFFYEQTKYKHNCGINEYTRIDDINHSDTISSCRTKDFGKVTNSFEPDGSRFWDGDIERNDPDLIAVIKKLGDEANDSSSNLHVVEIPDGTDYEIDEYDGLEHIAEAHQTWY